MSKEKFPYRISISLTNNQGHYLEGLVTKGEYDSIAQAVRDFIKASQDVDSMSSIEAKQSGSGKE